MKLNFIQIYRDRPLNKGHFIYYAILTGILSILFGIMIAITPRSVDDIWYLENSMGHKGSWDYFWSTVLNCWQHWQYDTGRLSNMAAAPFLALFPQWIYAALTSIGIWITYLGGPILSKSNFFSYSAAVWIVVITFIFPWFDFMFGIIFSINYVWTIALAVIYFYWFFKDYDKQTLSLLQKILLFVLSFILGWWHEGFSVPLIAAIATYFIIRKKFPDRTRLLMITGLFLGILMIVIMPAFWVQIHSRDSIMIKSVLWETLVGTVFICMFYLYLLIFIISICQANVRNELTQNRNRLLAFFSAILIYGIIGSAIYFKYYTGPRVGCYVQIISSFGLICIVKFFRTPRFLNKAYLKTSAVYITFLFSAVNLLSSIVIQQKLTNEFHDVMSLYSKSIISNDGVVFYDQTQRQLGLDLFKPSYKVLNTPYGLKHGLEYAKIIPKSLENFNPASTEISKCTDNGLFIFKNLVLKRGRLQNVTGDLMLKTSENTFVPTRAFFYEFKDIHGNVWTYIKTVSQTFNPDLKITDAKLSSL